MPEGPSIVILREVIQELHLKNKEILEVSGNVKTIDKDLLLHKKVRGFKTWGKHFLILFDDFTVRIHLLMFGTYLFDAEKSTSLKLGLTFGNHQVNFYTCDIRLIEGDINNEYDFTADIMADEWKPAKAIKKLTAVPDAFICDELLNQEIFSGAGNIIKNEVLYRSKVHPLSKIKDIPDAKLKLIVKEIRLYAFDFLTWKKAGTLKKHWEVYSKKECPLKHKLKKVNSGKLKRRSFFCDHCQKKYS
ncbi:DNA-formamidopyrimidine glycosylase family protein [Pedobacter rhodius]|uniref:Endonuclease n=1 Tax=Pedobacter rhodius TaxID=3004098 RepID=A0ABT4KVV2_9SPHI|nr:DNA-formamidopyrimidine glycosylase family protein [Pedobacter sp. SJ11]MCZ4223059.1 endonuclease [Pedobacter sp. SJ11]